MHFNVHVYKLLWWRKPIKSWKDFTTLGNVNAPDVSQKNKQQKWQVRIQVSPLPVATVTKCYHSKKIEHLMIYYSCQLMARYQLLPMLQRRLKMHNSTCNFAMTKILPCSCLGAVTKKINSTSQFAVTWKLPCRYLLLPKRYKDAKIMWIISSTSNLALIWKLARIYPLLPKRQKETKSPLVYSTSKFALTWKLPLSCLLLPKRYKEMKHILHPTFQWPTITIQLPVAPRKI